MCVFITQIAPGPGKGPLLAVKDLIDVVGTPTTAGSRAVADDAVAATKDALCIAGARYLGARINGKANLVELGHGGSGVNDYFGTPVNPLDPARLPGGSSSGSAVAVATEAADIAYGSDSGGSIRIPSAFCGTAGLKTTFGRIPLEGVRPLAPSLDTVGPMARDVGGLVLGMSLLEPGFSLDGDAAVVVGRLRIPGVDVDPAIDAAVDRALILAEMETVEIPIPSWGDAYWASSIILDWEAAQTNRQLTTDASLKAKLGPLVAARLDAGGRVPEAHVTMALSLQRRWVAHLDQLLDRVQLLATPAVAFFPPLCDAAPGSAFSALTKPVNLAGLPALCLPIPTDRLFPAGMHLIGPRNAEALLLQTGLHLERAVA
jgi:amidase